MNTVILEVKNLKTYYPIKSGLFSRITGYVRAVDDVSFSIAAGETLGLVGESGCGKTTVGRSILRLVDVTAGQVIYRGQDLLSLEEQAMRSLRKELQIIFQDPYSSLNPRITVGRMLAEILTVVGKLSEIEARERVSYLLTQVGLAPSYALRFPHEFSGGQRQRIAIARAIALNPSLIVCDEPVSALDVSVQAQIINLLLDIKEKYNIAYLFISHDLNVVRHISDRIGVMYLGSIVELCDAENLFLNPLHPYTIALLSAATALSLDKQRKSEVIILEGEVPSASRPMPGCRFSTRCWKADDRCRNEVPILQEVDKGHQVACWHPGMT